VFWHGLVSILRVYSPEQMKDLTHDLQAPDYSWQIGRIQLRGAAGGCKPDRSAREWLLESSKHPLLLNIREEFEKCIRKDRVMLTTRWTRSFASPHESAVHTRRVAHNAVHLVLIVHNRHAVGGLRRQRRDRQRPPATTRHHRAANGLRDLVESSVRLVLT
jgi:hypothetical protein